MNHAQSTRDLRTYEDKFERYREYKVHRMQATFGLDRDSAALALEWIELGFANHTLAVL